VPSIDSPIGRAVQRVAGSAAFAKVAPPVVPRLDRLLHKVTGGRVVLSDALVPSLVLTTTGATSGRPRPVPLACLPDGDALYVVGSNFGRENHPAWTGNLLRTPRAQVSFRGRSFEVDASLLSEDEKAEVWPELTRVWPTYDRYVERSGRDLRVFRLEPVEAGVPASG
jgi:deazaflavin-dependent oxidoreductase (nitroreductase family)